MRAAIATSFGSPDNVLGVIDDRPRPSVTGTKKVAVKVHACSLSPSDWRTLLGHADVVKKPASWPYIPGGDVAGVVEAIDEEIAESIPFKVGDNVIGTWDAWGEGGLSESTLIDPKLLYPKPASISFIDACSIIDSPVNAMLALEDAKFKSGDRILVIGGSGAVGGSIIQMAREQGASYIAATSTAADLVKSLGADLVIDYKSSNWWENPNFKNSPFDIIFDCAEGRTAWQHALKSKVLKGGRQGGRFMAVVPQDWIIEIHSSWQMMGWFLPVVGRQLRSRISPFSPRYTMLFPSPRGDSVERFLKYFQKGTFKVVLDPGSPFPLTTQGVKDAFNLLISRRAKGKIVITVP